MNRTTLWQFIKFSIAGGISALSSFVFYYIFLKLLNWWYLTASVTSFILSVFVGFYLQKLITFQDNSKEGIRRQMLAFFLVSLGNLLINVILMLFFVEALSIDKLFSKVLSIGILACWNFFVYRRFVF